MGRSKVQVKVYDRVSKTSKYFISINECARYFDTNIGSINQVVNRRDNNIYKYRYEITKISLKDYCSVMGDPDEE